MTLLNCPLLYYFPGPYIRRRLGEYLIHTFKNTLPMSLLRITSMSSYCKRPLVQSSPDFATLSRKNSILIIFIFLCLTSCSYDASLPLLVVVSVILAFKSAQHVYIMYHGKVMSNFKVSKHMLVNT